METASATTELLQVTETVAVAVPIQPLLLPVTVYTVSCVGETLIAVRFDPVLQV